MSSINPKIEKTSVVEKDGVLNFTLSGVNVSLANALRRIILSEISCVVFKTTPYEENKCTIISNTTRFNNEIVKQRLSCIPIHIDDYEKVPLKNYLLEVNVENLTDTDIYVTSGDFKIKNLIGLTEVKNKIIDQILYFVQGNHNNGYKCHNCRDCKLNIPCMKTGLIYVPPTEKPNIDKPLSSFIILLNTYNTKNTSSNDPFNYMSNGEEKQDTSKKGTEIGRASCRERV